MTTTPQTQSSRHSLPIGSGMEEIRIRKIGSALSFAIALAAGLLEPAPGEISAAYAYPPGPCRSF
jgi:hypothetical protein